MDTQQERDRYAGILEAYDIFLSLQNLETTVDDLTFDFHKGFIPSTAEFNDVRACLVNYQWHQAVDLLVDIACTSDCRFERDLAFECINQIEAK
ncbi:MAG: hypothetical protein WKF74_07095 [Pyrinomonadaceae bacterium]